jgi:predicted alpha/beta-hydrolase family hydrolase
MAVDVLWSGPDDAAATLILAHGAGAPMDHPWMNQISELLGERGIRVARFEFGYMASRRTGARKPPPRAETLMGEFRAVVEQVGGPVLIGGKSMGGRVASMVADELGVRGLVCLGYPFHPPGDLAKPRTAHLRELRTPTLICQGERDPFGTPEDVAGYELSPAITVRWFEGGDHGLKPRKGVTGLTEHDHLTTAADAIAGFAGG